MGFKCWPFRLALVAILTGIPGLLMSGCWSVQDRVIFEKDGSGYVRTTISVEQDSLSTGVMGVPFISEDSIRETLEEQLPSFATLTIRHDENFVYYDVQFSFRDPVDLEEKLLAIAPVRSVEVTRDEKSNRFTYRVEFDLPQRMGEKNGTALWFLDSWRHQIQVPGRIVSTNGTISGNTITWEIPQMTPFRAEATWIESSPVANMLAVATLAAGAVLLIAGLAIVFRRGRIRDRPMRQWAFCTQCGAELVPGSRFCGQCGATAES